jgi:hypothetical protein
VRPTPQRSRCRTHTLKELPVERDGLRMTFLDEHRPLEDYFRALEGAALMVERLREIADTSDDEGAARWRRIPLFLHIRAAHARVSSDG